MLAGDYLKMLGGGASHGSDRNRPIQGHKPSAVVDSEREQVRVGDLAVA